METIEIAAVSTEWRGRVRQLRAGGGGGDWAARGKRQASASQAIGRVETDVAAATGSEVSPPIGAIRWKQPGCLEFDLGIL